MIDVIALTSPLFMCASVGRTVLKWFLLEKPSALLTMIPFSSFILFQNRIIGKPCTHPNDGGTTTYTACASHF